MAAGKDVAKPAGTAVANWQEQLGKMAKATAESEKPSGNWVSFRGGVLKINDVLMKDNKVECVVIDSIFENQLYKNKFNADNPENPICFAFGPDDSELAPHPDSAEPQSASCATCPKNAWKSDPEGGKGKACKNVRRIAIMAATDLKSPAMVAKAEVAMAKLPVTSVKNWSTYASQIANVLKLPPLAVISEMSVGPHSRNMLEVNFELVSKIEDGDIIQALLQRNVDIQPLIYAPYEKNPPPAEKSTEQPGRKF